MLAAVIVFLLCVTTMNLVVCKNSLSTVTKRPMFASSKGASTSSNMQNGLGRYWKKAIMSATAVKAFSPPLSSELFSVVFPGGVATISMPLSGSRSSSRTMSAKPPPNDRRYSSWKYFRIVVRVCKNRSRESSSILAIVPIKLVFAPWRS